MTVTPATPRPIVASAGVLLRITMAAVLLGPGWAFGLPGAAAAEPPPVRAAGSDMTRQRVLTYGTYLGWGQRDEILAVTTDAGGATYVTGTRDVTFDTSVAGVSRATSTGFVAKLLPSGALAWLTTFDGKGEDEGRAIAVAAGGRVFVAGRTTSSDFPVIDPIQPVRAGSPCTVLGLLQTDCSDAILLALDPQGGIVFATTVGGSHHDRADAIALDALGVYITGSTSSTDFPILGATSSSVGPGFVTRLDLASRTVTFSVRLPGVGTHPTAVAARDDKVAVVGYTVDQGAAFESFSPTPGAFQNTFQGDSCESFRGTPVGACGDAFVMLLRADGSGALYATYLGGSLDDVATAVLIDSDASVTVAGYTRSTDFPSRNAYQSANASAAWTAWYYNYLNQPQGWDGFLARLTPSGDALLHSTYFGWVGDDVLHSIARTATGYAVAGVTNSSGFPIAADGRAPLLGPLRAGGDDARPWNALGRGLPPVYIGSIAFTDTPGTMFAAGGSVWRTTDGGGTWREIPLIEPAPPLSVYVQVQLQLAGNTVFAAAPSVSTPLSRWDPGGEAWVPVAGPEGASPYLRLLGSIGDALVVDGISAIDRTELFKTADAGRTWIRLASFDGDVWIASRPGNSAEVFAWGYGGLFRSTDGGLTFTSIDGAPAVSAVVPAPTRGDGTPAATYALTADDVLRSMDGGTTWTSIGQNLATPLQSLVIEPRSAALFGHTASTVWTWDGSWREVKTFDDGVIEQLWVDPHAPVPRMVAAMSGSYSTPQQAFVAEISRAGDVLESVRAVGPVWSWWFDRGVDIAADHANTLHIAGTTRSTLPLAGGPFQPTLAGDTDGFVLRLADPSGEADGDANGLPDAWEAQMGLSGALSDPLADPDHDGVTTRNEYLAGSHPNGVVRRYFAEGATGDLFDTAVALANPSDTLDAHVLLRFLDSGGVEHPLRMVLGPLTRRDIRVADVPGLARAEFSTEIESDIEVIADRRMTWDEHAYGSHTETAVASPVTTWYLAEGATHSGFDLFYLIANPGDVSAGVTVSYLRPAPAPPIEKRYTVAPRSRFTIWVNGEDPALASAEVSATITATVPINVERAMYLDTPGRFWGAGHASAGVTTPLTKWVFAEGATGTYFDLFVLVANPGDQEAAVTATFLRPSGDSVVKDYVVAPKSRFNIWVDLEDPLLADTAVSVTLESANGVPIVAERAMWWPGPTPATWYEGHNSAGAVATSPRWGIADGEDGGDHNVSTYLLIANTGWSRMGDPVTITLMFDDGTRAERTYEIPGRARFNISVRDEFPEARGRRFSAVVTGGYFRFTSSMDAPLAGGLLVVERAVYSDALGESWSAGGNALAADLQPYRVRLGWSSTEFLDLEIPMGAWVSFVNLASYATYDIRSDPHPLHDACPQLNIGRMGPGETRTVGPFLDTVTCGWHAEGVADDRTQGRITVR